MTATIRQRNVILEGDHVEFYGPGFRHFEVTSRTFTIQMAIRLTVHQTLWNFTITVP